MDEFSPCDHGSIQANNTLRHKHTGDFPRTPQRSKDRVNNPRSVVGKARQVPVKNSKKKSIRYSYITETIHQINNLSSILGLGIAGFCILSLLVR
ncbi:hypothetical protein BJX96DRAFT_16794 [Aspergillus floccosus]